MGDGSQSEDGLDISYPSQLIMLNAETGELIDLKSVLNSQTFSDSSSTVIDGEEADVIWDNSDSDDEGESVVDDSDSSDGSSDDGSVDINDLDLQVDDTADAVEE